MCVWGRAGEGAGEGAWTRAVVGNVVWRSLMAGERGPTLQTKCTGQRRVGSIFGVTLRGICVVFTLGVCHHCSW